MGEKGGGAGRGQILLHVLFQECNNSFWGSSGRSGAPGLQPTASENLQPQGRSENMCPSRAMVGCSLHHPQPRGDLRIAAHTRPTADCPQGRSCPGPLPSWGDLLDLVSPLKVGPGWTRPHPQSVTAGRPRGPWQRSGLGRALGDAERALERHDIPDGSLAACSAGVIVSFQSHLSPGAGSCPPPAGTGVLRGPGRAGMSRKFGSITQPAPPWCRGPHPPCGQAAMLPMLSQEASCYF